MASNKTWVVKSPKGTFQNSDPDVALQEFGKRYGTRGNITMNEAIVGNGMLTFQRGCRMFKGTFKSVQAEINKLDDSQEITAAADKPVKPAEYQEALRWLHEAAHGGDIVLDGESGEDGGRNKISTIMWRKRAKLIEVFTRSNKQEPWKKKEEFQEGRQSRQFTVYISKLLKKAPKEVSAEDKEQETKNQIGTYLQYLAKIRKEKIPVRVKLTTGLSEYKKILELCDSIHPDGLVRKAEKTADRLVASILTEAYIQAKKHYEKAKTEKRKAEWEFRMEIINGYKNGVLKGRILAKHVNLMSKDLRKYFKTDTKTVTALAINKAPFTHHAQSWKRILKQNGLEVDNVGVGLVQDMYFKFVREKLASGRDLPDTGSEERDLRDEFIEEQLGKIRTITGNAKVIASKKSVVVADEVISDRVASIIFGDVKRIRSTIASWKGKMKDNEYKEFVEYQKSLAKFIRDNYLGKLPQQYKDKISKL